MEPSAKDAVSARGYLDGQMLIAMPAMSDERFARTVIYVCAHSSEGAMGIVVNQAAPNIKFPDLLVQLEVIPASERIQLPGRGGGEGAQRRSCRARPRLRAALGRLLHRELDPANRRGNLPDRDARHPQGDRARQGPVECDPRTRLRRLGPGPARAGDPAERLAALRCRSRADLRTGHRAQI